MRDRGAATEQEDGEVRPKTGKDDGGLAIVGGPIVTLDPDRPLAEALFARGGRIVAVGDRADVEALAGPGTTRVALAGRCLLPGLEDAHVHVWKLGALLTTTLDLRSVQSLREIEALVRSAAAAAPAGRWILGRGYNEVRLAEGRAPTRADLDAACPDRPVYLTRTCGHMGVANGAALAAAGIGRDTPDPPGGVIVRDERGEPTGLVQETAIDLLRRAMPEPTAAELAAMIEAACRHLHRRGITAATDPGVDEKLLAVYRDLARSGRLASRLRVMLLLEPSALERSEPLPEPFEEGPLRYDTVKLFADGGLSGATAALGAPYRHAPTRGVLRMGVDELFRLADRAEAAGLHVATHVIGDRAIEVALEVYEALDRARPGRRRRFEHFALPDAAQIARAARLGVRVATQSIFLRELGENFRRFLPDGYLARTYPLRSMRQAGLTVALSSDAPVVEDDDPFAGMAAAVLRRDAAGAVLAPEEALGVDEALEGYTVAAAAASGEENGRGRLRPGMPADLVVVDRNPLETEPEGLASIRVEATYVAGEEVYRRGGSAKEAS